MNPSALTWTGPVRAFAEGLHYDGLLAGVRVARVVACRTLDGLPVLPYPSGRRRRLYLALVDVGGARGIVGVFKSLQAARRACAERIRRTQDITAEAPA